MLKKADQQGRRRVETGGVPWGYVKDFDEQRTKLAGFFSILLEGLTHIDHSPRGTRCSSSPALPRTPFHPYPKM